MEILKQSQNATSLFFMKFINKITSITYYRVCSKKLVSNFRDISVITHLKVNKCSLLNSNFLEQSTK